MRTAVLAAAWLVHGASMATTLGPGSAATASRAFVPQTAAAAAAASAASAKTVTLIAGQVSAVDAVRGVATIAGRPVPLHGSRLQVFFERGGRATLADLRPGSRVQFALEPVKADDPAHGEGRRIVLIYIERGP